MPDCYCDHGTVRLATVTRNALRPMDNWKHRYVHSTDPFEAFQIWLDAKWPHEGKLSLAIEMYGKDPEVDRLEKMRTPHVTIGPKPF